jgi:hypothetical protein
MRGLALVTFAISAFIVTSCINRAMTLSLMHPGLTIEGAYEKTLTSQDIDEIVAVSAQRDIRQPLDVIRSVAPSVAEVESGGPEKTGDPTTSFKVKKMNGHWSVVPKSIIQGTSLVIRE